MSIIDVTKWTLEYLRSILGYSDISEDDINWRGHMKVTSIKDWKKKGGTNYRNIFNTVTFNNRKTSALAQISVPVSEKGIEVLLSKGIVRGLHDGAKILLPLQRTGLTEHFGKSRKIDLEQIVQEFKETRHAGMAVKERKLRPGKTYAVVRHSEAQAEYDFKCEVAMNVTMTTIFGDEYPFAEIIRDLREATYDEELDCLEVDRSRVYFDVCGTAMFNWNTQHCVDWHQTEQW